MSRTIALFVMVATVFAACGGESSTGSAPTAEIGPAATPEDSFRNLQKVLKAGDWKAMVRFIPPSKLPEAKAQFEAALEDPESLEMRADMLGVAPEVLKAMDYETATARMFESMFTARPAARDSMAAAEVEQAIIEGDKATLTTASGDDKGSITFLQEDGLWYRADFGY